MAADIYSLRRYRIRHAARRISTIVVLCAIGAGFLSLHAGRVRLPEFGWSSEAVKALASPEPGVSGWARVVDGDTIQIDGQRIRFVGIDAPESEQTCRKASGTEWPCGVAAADMLADRIGFFSTVTCVGTDHDTFGRLLAVCSAHGEDLSAWMVRQGWALAYRQYSSSYIEEEAAARAARAGIWAGTFETPWDYRRTHKES